MKGALLFFLIVLTTASVGFSKLSGDWRYTLNSSKEIVINSYEGAGGAIAIPNTLDGYPVKALGEASPIFRFDRAPSVSSVTIPESVTNIGELALSSAGLTEISVALDNPVYASIEGVLFDKALGTLLAYPPGKRGSYTIPNGVTKIGNFAFGNCESLTSVTIPDSVTIIGDCAFRNCMALENVTIPTRVMTIGRWAFSRCLSVTSLAIPEGVKSIGDHTFDGCSGLTNVTIPDSLKTIGDFAFSECKKLRNVTMPHSITQIGTAAFGDCTGLTNVIFPRNLKTISGFDGCTGLTDVRIPEGVTNIAVSAFRGCTGLTNVSFPNTVTSISGFSGCRGLTNLNFPYGVRSIEEFSDCTGLTNVIMPDSVRVISGFRGCTGLTNVTIPSGVTTIVTRAFEGCTGLTNVNIPNSVTNLGLWSFSGCTGLKKASIPEGLASDADRAFFGCDARIEHRPVQFPKQVQVTVTNSEQEPAAKFASCFPVGFNRLAPQITTSDQFIDRGIDCDKFYRASELWIKESDPTKKLYARVRLQGLVFEFYNSLGEQKLANFSKVEPFRFYKRMLDILVGGEIERKEVLSKKREKMVKLQDIHPLDIDLGEVPEFFRRNNQEVFEFSNKSGTKRSAYWISLTPLGLEKFQVFARKTGNEGKIESLIGFLFGKEGKLLASLPSSDALAASFEDEGRMLLVLETEDGVEPEPEMARCLVEMKSAQGKTLWTRSLQFESEQSMRGNSWDWRISPSTNHGKWLLEAWDSGIRGWWESSCAFWEIRPEAKNKVRKLGQLSFGEDDNQQMPLPVDTNFRYARSTYHHSISASGQIGFEVGCSRHVCSPLWMSGYKIPVKVPFIEDDANVGCLRLPRTDEVSPFRNTWPNSKSFFVGSECYWPVIGAFFRERQGITNTAGDIEKFITRSWDESGPLGEPATFFFDPIGDLQGWSMGYVAGDAGDGSSLLLARSNGQLLTVSPALDVTVVRRFVAPDGKEAKPVVMLDSNRAGVFLVGKSLVVGTWKQPLLERIFSSPSGRKRNKAAL